jgi:hypothetical protein
MGDRNFDESVVLLGGKFCTKQAGESKKRGRHFPQWEAGPPVPNWETMRRVSWVGSVSFKFG